MKFVFSQRQLFRLQAFGWISLSWLIGELLQEQIWPAPALAQSAVAQPRLMLPSVVAQPRLAQTSSGTSDDFVFNPPSPPNNQGSPTGRRQGGASRGSCNEYAGLTALIPNSNDRVEGTTVLSQPTFFFFIPTALSSEAEVELVVQSQDDEYIARNRLNLQTKSAGILPITLQKPVNELEVGQTYKWTLSIYCDPASHSASVYVQGLLNRARDKASHPDQMETFSKAAQYAEQGVWLESLALLAKLRQAEPSNAKFTQAWHKLLQQVELESIAKAEILKLN